MANEPRGQNIAALSLGGNMGDVAQTFRLAIAGLRSAQTIEIIGQSSVWRTAPWGKTDQPDFLNMALLISTSLSPQDLLNACLAIEESQGRQRAERWGPRTLDIDVITYNDLELKTGPLELPHPRAHLRRFVLAPLAEIAPDLEIKGRSVASWLELLVSENSASSDTAVAVDQDATKLIGSV